MIKNAHAYPFIRTCAISTLLTGAAHVYKTAAVIGTKMNVL